MKNQTINGAGLEGTYGINNSCCQSVLLFLAFTLSSLSSRLSWKSPKQKLLMCEYILSIFQTFIYDNCKYSVTIVSRK